MRGPESARLDQEVLALDLVQDMYLRLHRVSERLSGYDEARNYLMKMAINAPRSRRMIKLHGSADVMGFANAIRVGVREVQQDVRNRISAQR